jgi:hypothetical protein
MKSAIKEFVVKWTWALWPTVDLETKQELRMNWRRWVAGSIYVGWSTTVVVVVVLALTFGVMDSPLRMAKAEDLKKVEEVAAEARDAADQLNQSVRTLSRAVETLSVDLRDHSRRQIRMQLLETHTLSCILTVQQRQIHLMTIAELQEQWRALSPDGRDYPLPPCPPDR